MAYRIIGGRPLCGCVSASGSKNAALPILFATLLTKERVVLTGVPDIGDVRDACALLQAMGARVERQEHTVTVCAENVSLPPPDAAEIRRMRGSSYLLGAGLCRLRSIKIARPGGCKLGARPLDIHVAAFRALGASVEENEHLLVRGDGLLGADIHLSYPSVGATINAVLAALGAKGRTHIYGYAREPHVYALLSFLCALGASVVAEEDAVTVDGDTPLHGCHFHIPPDDIEASTYLVGGALLGERVTVEGVDSKVLAPLLSLFTELEIPYAVKEGSVTVSKGTPSHSVRVVCAPYPALPTDLNPQLAVLLSALGGGTLTDLVFPERFAYVNELARLGFQGEQRGGMLTVLPSRLHGSRLCVTDLRGGAAMMLAAFASSGESVLFGTELIERGYESPLSKWKRLGAYAEPFSENG